MAYEFLKAFPELNVPKQKKQQYTFLDAFPELQPIQPPAITQPTTQKGEHLPTISPVRLPESHSFLTGMYEQPTKSLFDRYVSGEKLTPEEKHGATKEFIASYPKEKTWEPRRYLKYPPGKIAQLAYRTGKAAKHRKFGYFEAETILGVFRANRRNIPQALASWEEWKPKIIKAAIGAGVTTAAIVGVKEYLYPMLKSMYKADVQNVARALPPQKRIPSGYMDVAKGKFVETGKGITQTVQQYPAIYPHQMPGVEPSMLDPRWKTAMAEVWKMAPKFAAKTTWGQAFKLDPTIKTYKLAEIGKALVKTGGTVDVGFRVTPDMGAYLYGITHSQLVQLASVMPVFEIKKAKKVILPQVTQPMQLPTPTTVPSTGMEVGGIKPTKRRGRPKEYELRWTGKMLASGKKELEWVKIEKPITPTVPRTIPAEKEPWAMTLDAAEGMRGWTSHKLEMGLMEPDVLAKRGMAEAVAWFHGKGDIEIAKQNVKYARTSWAEGFGGKEINPQYEKDILRAEKVLQQVQEAKKPIVPRTIPAELEGLAKEARKYGSAEEFIKAQPIVYHGTPEGGFDVFSKEFKGKRTGHKPDEVGFHFTDNKEYAQSYSKEYLKEHYAKLKATLGYIPESMKVPPKAETIEAILDIKNPLMLSKSKDITASVIKKAVADGYDGIITQHGDGKEYVVFEPSQIKTKAQLINFYQAAKSGEAVGRKTREAGFIRIPSIEETGDIVSKAIGKIDIEYPFRRIGAPKTGFSVKNYHTKRVAYRRRGEEAVKQFTKLRLTDKEYQEATFVSAQPTLFVKYTPEQRQRLSGAYQIWNKIRTEEAKKLKEYEVIAEEWPRSLILRLQEESRHLKTVVGKLGIKAARRTKLKQQIVDNENTIAFLKKHKIQYMHIPLRVWLEDLFKEKPKQAPRIISRFFHKREVVDLRSFANHLVKEGILKPKDLDIRDITAAYYDKLGKIYALSDIFQNARKEGLGKPIDQTPENWQMISSRLVPELKGYRWQPAFAEWVQNYIKKVGPGMAISRPLAYIKIMQFDNPLFLPAYDTYQATWAASYRTPLLPFYARRAAISMWKKDQHYWDAWDHGAFSQPYIPPFESFKKDVELAKENSFVKRMVKELAQNMKVPPDVVYRPLWKIAWGGDRFIRMMTYHQLLSRGFAPTEAGQLSAKFHSDYASVPPETRRVLNKLFFTPIFPITMGKLQGSMVKAVGQTLADAARMRNPSRRAKLLAAGLVTLMGIIMGRKYVMKKMGFKEEDFGVRYVKEVETPEGTKELVLYIPTPDNILLRHYHRWKTFPTDSKKIEGFVNRAKWTLHPLWRVIVQNLQNRQSDNSPICYPNDDLHTQMAKRLKFTLMELVHVLKRFDDYDPKTRKPALQQLEREMGKFWTTLLKPISVTYLRETKEVRAGWRIRELEREFRKYINKTPEEDLETLDKRAENFEKKIEAILKEIE